MVLTMSLLTGAYWLTAIITIIASFLPLGFYISPGLLFLLLALHVTLMPLALAWRDTQHRHMLLQAIITILFSILIYALLLQKSGLENNTGETLSFIDSFYVSLAIWTGTSHEDVATSQSIKAIMSLEAFNSYLAMSFLIGLLLLWVDAEKNKAAQYVASLKNISIKTPSKSAYEIKKHKEEQ